MEEGFLLDKGDAGSVSPQTWIAGHPVKSRFLGLKYKAQDIYNVKTYRCIACNYLESYAESAQQAR